RRDRRGDGRTGSASVSQEAVRRGFRGAAYEPARRGDRAGGTRPQTQDGTGLPLVLRTRAWAGAQWLQRGQGGRPVPSLVFRWYFEHALGQALSGSSEGRVDFQVHCGPALGSFNQWVKGTELEVWQRRHVADINLRILREAADLLTRRLNAVATG